MRLTANQIIDLISSSLRDGGNTIHLTAKTGRYVVGDGTHGLKFPVNELRTLCVTDLADSFSTLVRLIHLTNYWRELGYDTVGGWVDEGTFYLDPGNVHDDEQEARRVALERGELAIYDTHAGVCIDTSGRDNAAHGEPQPEGEMFTLRDAVGDTFEVTRETVQYLLDLYTKHPKGLCSYDFVHDTPDYQVIPSHLVTRPVLNIIYDTDVDGCSELVLVWASNEDLMDHLRELLA